MPNKRCPNNPYSHAFRLVKTVSYAVNAPWLTKKNIFGENSIQAVQMRFILNNSLGLRKIDQDFLCEAFCYEIL